MIFLFLNSCSQNQTTSDNLGQSEVIQESASTDCANKPQVSLKKENIENINFDNSPVTQSGIIKQNEMIGYRFEGEADQRLKYQTGDNICVWIFTPNNELLQETKLPMTGTYVMQVSTPIGSRSFTITASLEQNNSLSSQRDTVKRVNKKTSPTQAIIEHYQQLQSRNYEKTWSKLSPDFKQDKLSNRFNTYTNWWNQVQTIKIGQVKLINELEKTAIVDAQLTYLMEDGDQHRDKKSRIKQVRRINCLFSNLKTTAKLELSS